MIESKIFRAVFIFLLVIVSILNCIGFVEDSFFYSIDDVPNGEYLYSSTSPNGTYTLKTFRVENCLGTAVRGELVNNEDAESKNIYWSTDFPSATVVWHNDSLVSINGTMLDLSLEHIYDSREKTDVEFSLVKMVE